MLSQPPEITTSADDSQPAFGAPVRTRHSPETDPQGRPLDSPVAPRMVGRHRRVGVEPADKFLLDIPTPHRPTTLADSPPTYRAAFLTDDIPWSRPSVSDETPRYRASRAAENIPRQRPARPADQPVDPQAGPTADPPTRSRHQATPGRRRAQQDSAWDKATGAVQRAATGLTRRAAPPHPRSPDPTVPAPGTFDPAPADLSPSDRVSFDRGSFDRGPSLHGRTFFDPTFADATDHGRFTADRFTADRFAPDPDAHDPDAHDPDTRHPDTRHPGRHGRGTHELGAAAKARAIVVRPLPLSRDSLAEQSQAARRVAGAVRDWTLDETGPRPVTGSRRAPGTLPIESWLLIGRHRQQALLAALVAVGIALVMIPSQRGPDEVTTVNAADRSAATGTQGQAADRKPGAAPAGAANPADAAEAAEAAHRVTPDGKPGAAPTTAPAPEPGGAVPEQPPLTDKQPSTAPSDAAPTAPAPGETASGVSPDAQGPAQSLRRTGTDVVALTFDDGPDPVQTPRLLELLASHQVTATFCLVGERAQAHPDLVRQIAAAGHTLCNHSWNHSFTLGAQPPEVIRKDLEATDKAIRDAVPDAPIPYFRAPGGIFTDRLVAVAGEYEMKSLYWEVDPRDWDHTADADDAEHVERVVAEVKRDVRPGSIVLSHDFNQPQTIVAYEQLLPYLTETYELGLP